MSIPEWPREANEFIAVPVTLNGSVVTVGISYAVVRDEGRPPTSFPFPITPTVVNGATGIMSGDSTAHTPGTYHAWAYLRSTPEDVVVDCGLFKII